MLYCSLTSLFSNSWFDVFTSDVMLAVLSDVIFLMTDANHKLNFYSQDNKVKYLLFYYYFSVNTSI